MVKEIKENELNDILKNNKKVVLDCFASWCGPCKMLSPILDEISQENTNYKFYKVDVDDAYDLSTTYQIMSIPTLLVFEEGKLANTIVGLRSKEELEELFK